MNSTQKVMLARVLEQIRNGVQDPHPTRSIPPVDNKAAWDVDQFWVDYYASNNKSIRLLAVAALNILYETDHDTD